MPDEYEKIFSLLKEMTERYEVIPFFLEKENGDTDLPERFC